jgi:two-component system, NarL family, sensor histidine kinase ComP
MDTFYDHVFKHIPIGIAVFSFDGMVIKVNSSLSKIVGYTEEEIGNMKLNDFIHPDDFNKNERLMTMLLNGNRSEYEIEIRLIHSLGHAVWISYLATIIRNETNDPIYFISQIQDITEKKKLREQILTSEAKYRLIAENTSDLIGIFDSELNFVYASPSHNKLTWGTDSLDGKNVLHYVHPDDIPFILEKIQEMKDTKERRGIEHRIIQSNGKMIDVEAHYTPIFDEKGELENIVYVTRDISEKRAAEKVIIENEKLYRNLNEGLNYISRETTKIMNKQDLMNMLLTIVGRIFETEMVGVIDAQRNGKIVVHEPFSSIPLPDKKLFSSDKPLFNANGFVFVRIGTSQDTTYFIVIEVHDQQMPKPLIQWLLTISRFSEILLENILQIEDMVMEIKYLIKEKQGPTWLSRLLFKVAEQQRMKLSIDLHDAALQEQIIWYRKLTEFINDANLSQPLDEKLRLIHDGFEEVIHQIRITCNELAPPFLKKSGIVNTLEFLFQETHIRIGDYVIHFHHEGEFSALNDDQILGIYRIVQELLANATKHSKATSVQFGLFNKNNQIKLTYQDNGIGMDEKVFYGITRQIGLSSIQERVRSLEGQIHFKASDSGLKIEIHLPLQVDWMDDGII